MPPMTIKVIDEDKYPADHSVWQKKGDPEYVIIVGEHTNGISHNVYYKRLKWKRPKQKSLAMFYETFEPFVPNI
jgi:hypothetical protein